MEWVETTGKTLEEAEEAALDELGVAKEDAEFEVLSEARAGLFGRVRSEARVRARVRPTRPRPKEDRRGRRRRPRADQEDRVGGPSPKTGEGEDVGGVVNSNEDEDQEDPGGGQSAEVPLAEQAEVARTFLSGLLDKLDLDGDVTVREIDADTVEVAVEGDDLALLIGPRGTTVEAVQDLARTVVQRRTGARHGRLLVDVAGYREKRRRALERFTRKVAEEVLSSGGEEVLEPMSPADRKVVHDTVNTIPGVSTRSEGEEPRRRVVISPQSGD